MSFSAPIISDALAAQPPTAGRDNLIAAGGAVLLPAERRIVLEDINRIGLALGRDLAAGGVPVSPSGPPQRVDVAVPLERIRLLEALWPQVQAALCAIVRQPDSRLYIESISTLPSLSSGSPLTAAAVARTPGGMAAWAAIQRDRHTARTPLLPEHRFRVTPVTPANRLAATLLRDLECEARTLVALANACGEAGEAARADYVAGAARRWRMGTFLREIGLLTVQEQSNLLSVNALRCAPSYRALLRLFRTLQQSLKLENEDRALLVLPSLPDWRLYEIWCFLMVAGTLRHLGWRATEGDALRWQADGLVLAPATGRSSRLRFTHDDGELKGKHRGRREVAEADLYYQPLFVSANRKARTNRQDADENSALPGYASLSHAMQPDIALCFHERLYLLDPKFRTYAPSDTNSVPDSFPARESSALQEDVNKMHAYRDAIVHGGKPAVAAGWCLFPGEPDPASGPDILAYPASTPRTPFGTAGVGAIRLRPGGKKDALEKLILHWLDRKKETSDESDRNHS